MELDTGASATIIHKSMGTYVLALKPVERGISSYAVIPGTKFLLLEKLMFKLRIVTEKQYWWKWWSSVDGS